MKSYKLFYSHKKSALLYAVHNIEFKYTFYFWTCQSSDFSIKPGGVTINLKQCQVLTSHPFTLITEHINWFYKNNITFYYLLAYCFIFYTLVCNISTTWISKTISSKCLINFIYECRYWDASNPGIVTLTCHPVITPTASMCGSSYARYTTTVHYYSGS